MKKVRIATVWLDGCSGCHMSFLDLDQRLLTIAVKAELVYSPLVDIKEFPKAVDVTLVEGAVSSVEDLEKIRMVRARTKILIALGDCAVTSNVPSMRNPFGTEAVYNRAYIENTVSPQIPSQVVPALLPQARPIHEFVRVDVFAQGCPPSADAIFQMISEILEGRVPILASQTKFG
jgi:NAD-reducing hydrogenase small subunit